MIRLPVFQAARRALAERAGSAAVEFALIIPVALTFVFGIWYMGWALNCGSEVRHAVELGSRIYVTNPTATQSDLTTAVDSHLIAVSSSAITLNVASKTEGSATVEHITYSYSTTAPIPFISAIPLTFSGSVDAPLATP
jgi:Flp pilus assembly protein TadG